MARIKTEQQALGVAPQAQAQPVAPEFDPSRPYTDAHKGQEKYWLQNGWLYRRGSGEPVREVK